MTVTSTVELDELVPVLEVGLDFSVCPVDRLVWDRETCAQEDNGSIGFCTWQERL